MIIAATPMELPPATATSTSLAVCCGVGPVDAAVQTARALALHAPRAVLHVGIAGAKRASGLVPGQIVIGQRARYHDLVIDAGFAPSVVEASTVLLQAAVTALPGAVLRDIGTSAQVGGTSDAEVEAMEGFAVLRACQLTGVPALEVRVISNAIEEQDRAKWQFGLAFAALRTFVPPLLAAFDRIPDEALGAELRA
jgi:nucleoside phosphorylase